MPLPPPYEYTPVFEEAARTLDTRLRSIWAVVEQARPVSSHSRDLVFPVSMEGVYDFGKMVSCSAAQPGNTEDPGGAADSEVLKDIASVIEDEFGPGGHDLEEGPAEPVEPTEGDVALVEMMQAGGHDLPEAPEPLRYTVKGFVEAMSKFWLNVNQLDRKIFYNTLDTGRTLGVTVDDLLREPADPIAGCKSALPVNDDAGLCVLWCLGSVIGAAQQRLGLSANPDVVLRLLSPSVYRRFNDANGKPYSDDMGRSGLWLLREIGMCAPLPNPKFNNDCVVWYDYVTAEELSTLPGDAGFVGLMRTAADRGLALGTYPGAYDLVAATLGHDANSPDCATQALKTGTEPRSGNRRHREDSG
jgi:hypothetical protein